MHRLAGARLNLSTRGRLRASLPGLERASGWYCRAVSLYPAAPYPGAAWPRPDHWSVPVRDNTLFQIAGKFFLLWYRRRCETRSWLKQAVQTILHPGSDQRSNFHWLGSYRSLRYPTAPPCRNRGTHVPFHQNNRDGKHTGWQSGFYWCGHRFLLAPPREPGKAAV